MKPRKYLGAEKPNKNFETEQDISFALVARRLPIGKKGAFVIIGIRAVVDNLSVAPLISRLGLQTKRPAKGFCRACSKQL